MVQTSKSIEKQDNNAVRSALPLVNFDPEKQILLISIWYSSGKQPLNYWQDNKTFLSKELNIFARALLYALQSLFNSFFTLP